MPGTKEWLLTFLAVQSSLAVQGSASTCIARVADFLTCTEPQAECCAALQKSSNPQCLCASATAAVGSIAAQAEHSRLLSVWTACGLPLFSCERVVEGPDLASLSFPALPQPVAGGQTDAVLPVLSSQVASGDDENTTDDADLPEDDLLEVSTSSLYVKHIEEWDTAKPISLPLSRPGLDALTGARLANMLQGEGNSWGPQRLDLRVEYVEEGPGAVDMQSALPSMPAWMKHVLPCAQRGMPTSVDPFDRVGDSGLVNPQLAESLALAVALAQELLRGNSKQVDVEVEILVETTLVPPEGTGALGPCLSHAGTWLPRSASFPFFMLGMLCFAAAVVLLSFAIGQVVICLMRGSGGDEGAPQVKAPSPALRAAEREGPLLGYSKL